MTSHRNYRYKLPEKKGEVWRLCSIGGVLMKIVYSILLSFIYLTLCHSTNSHNYRYDDLYRLIHAEGEQVNTDTTKYTLDMAYDVMGNPLYKKEDILSGGNPSQESSDILYSYTHDKPNAASWIGNRKMEYDKNGNLEYWTDTLTNGYRHFQWNEDNQLLGVEENGYISRYTYDSQGERVIKAHGGIQGVFINGAPAASIIKAEQVTTYISPFMTVTGGRFTKHYYAGTKRIASKIGNGTFNNQYRPGSHNILAGGVNCIERYNQIEQNKKEYIRSLGVPPGPPTMKGIYAEPEYSGQAFPDGGTPQNTTPANWPRKPIQAPPGGPPCPPVQYGPDITNETANGGFGFITTGHIEETDRYFYHSDHLGSSSYITDWKGNVSQFMVYLPFGELLVDKHVTGKSEMPYKFNAKEKDEETGLYYYGARYYKGKDQVWMGVDPLWEKYPGVSPYAYCANNPTRYTDPTGMYIESAWDVFSLGLGVKSFVDNVRAGNVGAAILDGVGVVADAAAVALPLIPGGAGAAIKGVRAVDKAVDAVSAANKVDNVVDGARSADKMTDIKTFGGKQSTQSVTQKEAFGKAKEANAIPRSQQPDKTIKPNTPEGKAAGLDNRNVKQYEYTNSKGEKVTVRQDKPVSESSGKGTQPAHYNAGEDKKLKQHHTYGN